MYWYVSTIIFMCTYWLSIPYKQLALCDTYSNYSSHPNYQPGVGPVTQMVVDASVAGEYVRYSHSSTFHHILHIYCLDATCINSCASVSISDDCEMPLCQGHPCAICGASLPDITVTFSIQLSLNALSRLFKFRLFRQ